MESTDGDKERTRDRFPAALGIILVVGLLARLLVWWPFWGTSPRIVDETHYNEIAVNLVEQGEFRLGNAKTSLRPPLYPFTIAGVYQVFGVERFDAVRGLQVLMSLLNVVVVYYLARSVFDERTSLLASAFQAFYPTLLVYNHFLLTETQFTLLFSLSVLCVARFLTGGSMAWLPAAGLFLGLGALGRSILVFAAPLIGLYIVLFGGGPLLRRIVGVLALGLVFAATILPWTLRNTQLQRTFTTIDCMSGRNLMMGNYEHTPLFRSWATIDLIKGEDTWDNVLARRFPEARGMTQGQKDKLALRYALEFIKQHPLLTLQRDAVKFINFWQLEREILAGLTQELWGKVSKPVILSAAALIVGAYIGSLFTGIFGFVLTPAPLRVQGFLFCAIAYFCAMHTLAFAHSRYHLPLLPLIFLYSAHAIVNARSIWNQRGSLRFLLACGLCGALAAGWTFELIAMDLARIAGSIAT